MTATFMGIPVLDSIINYIETNSDSLDPYKLKFEANSTYTEYDQSNAAIEEGTWSLSGDQLTVNTPDTILVLTVNSIDKSDATITISLDESGSDEGFNYDIDLTQKMYLNRE
ncbi:MAG: hypothetical protein HOC66_04580 [Flavobacteriales bacterium]|nr:hypothetical protein [Flavobacteriales bacterium]